jgi:hypothetical protein
MHASASFLGDFVSVENITSTWLSIVYTCALSHARAVISLRPGLASNGVLGENEHDVGVAIDSFY